MLSNVSNLSEEELENQRQIHLIDDMIAENQNSETIENTTSRFSSAEWYEAVQNSDILLAGVGGIGSWTALLLARMKPRNLYMYDDDIVELVNMSGQLYSLDDIEKMKVDALHDTIRNYAAYDKAWSIGSKFTEESEAYDIMICGFDNMSARKMFFHKWLDRVKNTPIENRWKCLFIDGRLNAEKFQVISIQGNDYFNMKRYEKEFLFEDGEVENALCSYKQTTYCASMIASFICNSFVNFVCHSDARPLIFFQEYDAELMSLKQEM